MGTKSKSVEDTSALLFSVVLPIYNERGNLPRLFDELAEVMEKIGQYEVLCVDDGSTDSSRDFIKYYLQKHPQFKAICLAFNQGQSAALYAGFLKARGKYIITMDSDLQNDPADLLYMVGHLSQFDMVVGWRRNRQDSFMTKSASRIANYIRNKLSRETIKDTGCSLRIMKNSMLQNITMFDGGHRFLPTLMKMEGAKVIEVSVSHRQRLAGVSKYGIRDRAWCGFIDLLGVRWLQKRRIHLEVNGDE